LIVQPSNFVQIKAGLAGSGKPGPPRIVATAYSPSGTAGPQPGTPVVIAVEAKGTGDGCYRALPSGLFALTVHLDRDMLLHALGSGASRASAVTPIRTVYQDMSMTGVGHVVIAFLTPLAMTQLLCDYDLLGRADELPAAALLGGATVRRIHDRLTTAASPGDAVHIVYAELETQMRTRRAPPPAAVRTARTAMRILAQPSDSLDQVTAYEGVSRRQLVRDFRRYLGLSPKAYSLVARAQSAAAAIAAGLPLSEVALQAGFSDQSHLSNALKRVTELTALQIRTRSALESSVALRSALSGYLVAV